MIIGSECDAQQRLGFVGELATDLYDELLHAGDWRPAVGGDMPRLNPTIHELKAAVKDAFAAANAARATLLIAFVGHGLTTAKKDFYLLSMNSPADPDSESAYHLTQGIRERLATAPYLDGLIVLIDACEAGEAVAGAADRWVEMLAASSGRMELLVSTGESYAYNGCFTRTLTTAFASGVENGGEYLLCADLQPYVAQCPGQEPQYLAFNGRWVERGDPGLWLIPNKARQRDCVSGRPAAGFVDLLTTGVLVTGPIRAHLTAIGEADAARLRLVVGPAGSGKSTLLALLIRPGMVDTFKRADDYIQAAVFLDEASTLESMAAEMSTQLTRTVKGFDTAVQAVVSELSVEDRVILGSFDVTVTRPLERCIGTGRRFHLIIDGLDQPETGARAIIVAAIRHVTQSDNPALADLRFIVGARTESGIDTAPELAHAVRFETQSPTTAELISALKARSFRNDLPTSTIEALANTFGANATGGWLIVRLVNEITGRVDNTAIPGDLGALVELKLDLLLLRDSPSERGGALQIMSLLAAAGVGPVLPIALLAAALDVSKHSMSVSRIRDTLVELGTLVTRGNPGQQCETIGLSHIVLLDPFTRFAAERDHAAVSAHNAILDAHLRDFTHSTDEDVAHYWITAAPRHYLGGRDADGAIEFLSAADKEARPTDNRDRWITWQTAFTEVLGQDHRLTFTARSKIAYWRGVAGDYVGAIEAYEHLLADIERVLGSDHPDGFATRAMIGRWHSTNSDHTGAIDTYEGLLAGSPDVVVG